MEQLKNQYLLILHLGAGSLSQNQTKYNKQRQLLEDTLKQIKHYIDKAQIPNNEILQTAICMLEVFYVLV